MARTVTAGLEGSPESLSAAHWAAREALRRGLPLRLVHAWKWQSVDDEPPGSELRRHWAERVPREARDVLRRSHPGLEITIGQVPMYPVPGLLAAAKETELLAIGSRGVSGFSGYMMGSVALDVVARTERPVVLIRAGERESDEHVLDDAGRPSTRTPYRDVLLGLDVERPRDPVIAFAFEAAALRDATLRVVHGWKLPDPYGYGTVITPDLYDELTARNADLLTEVLRPWRAKFPDVVVAEQAVAGRTADCLLDAAPDAGLVVVGRRARGLPVGPRIGPVIHAVLHHAPAPVAVVPHD